MKTIHTHRGHCQLCGAIQAIDVLHRGLVAKHGYTVDGGYFNGTCPGSDRPNLHIDRALADEYIARARDNAARLRATATAYEVKADHPHHVWNGTHVMVRPLRVVEESVGYSVGAYTRALWCPLKEREVTVSWNDATPEWQEKGRTREIVELREAADRETHYADTIQKFADDVHGKIDPYPVNDGPKFKVGDKVRVFGKQGFDARVEAVDQKPSRGFRRTNFEWQAQVTRPAKAAVLYTNGCLKGEVREPAREAATFWVSFRSLKPVTDGAVKPA
jgi:hypothetical protein